MTRDDFLRELVNKEDVISSKKLFEDLAAAHGVTCIKRDFLFRTGRFDGIHSTAVMRQANSEIGPVLVTGHSDYPLRNFHAHLLRMKGIRHIFATNAVPSSRVTPLPLGVTSTLTISTDHLVLGNHKLIREAWRAEPHRPEFDASIYMNMTVDTAKSPRTRLQKVLGDCSGVIQQLPDKTDLGRINFLRSLRRANFVPAPIGNGVDTHRLWETLYMGGFPIILTNRRLNSLVADLPVLVVSEWQVLRDKDFLYRAWERLNHGSFKMETLQCSYWVRAISQMGADLSQD